MTLLGLLAVFLLVSWSSVRMLWGMLPHGITDRQHRKVRAQGSRIEG